MRLEWGKIATFLADFSTFPHTKKQLSQLLPWLTSEIRDFYFDSTSEMLELNTLGNSLALEPFDLELFDKHLHRGSYYRLKLSFKF